MSCVAPGWLFPWPGAHCRSLGTSCKAGFGQHLTVVNRKWDLDTGAELPKGWCWRTGGIKQEGMRKVGGWQGKQAWREEEQPLRCFPAPHLSASPRGRGDAVHPRASVSPSLSRESHGLGRMDPSHDPALPITH